MSKVDTAWLRMESPTNLMMITGVMVLEGLADYERIKATFDRRFLAFDRFRQRPVEANGGTVWETDPNFDIESHVCRTALPGRADKMELEALVSRLASTPLDQSKPMWQVHLVENYQDDSALIVRIHHCYADGIAMIQVLLMLTDTTSDAPLPAARRSRKSRLLKDQGSVLDRLYRPASRGLDIALDVGGRARDEVVKMLRQPDYARAYLRDVEEVMGELAEALALPDDPTTRFRGRLGNRKRVAWCEPISLDEVKTVAKALDATVNDVLLAAVSGALRGYLSARGDAVDGLEIRATVPVNLRPLEHAKDLGNHFGLVFLSLPIGVSNPLERLYLIKQRMRALKASKQAVMTFGALAVLGLTPGAVQRKALDLLSRKATAVMTNVPGPQQPLYLGGSRIVEQMFWVPQTGSVGMGVSILSYDRRVQFGLITDLRLVPDPNRVIDRFAGEFEKLLLITLMAPWDGHCDPREVESGIRALLRQTEP
jgi:WS/DGAT/MGAT family acyltransferase